MVSRIISQDRNAIYPFTEQSHFSVKDVFHGNLSLGFNLFMDKHFLGSYSTFNDALQEMCEIHNRDEEFYGVGGYSDWEQTPEYDDITIILKGTNT